MSGSPAYQRFFAELKRRRVFRVAAVYGGSAFVVLQVVDVMAEGLNLSAGVLQTVTVLILVGFPIALALAWAFQVTPEGLRRTEPATKADLEAIVAQPRGQRWPAGIFGLLGGIAIATAGWWALGPRAGGPSAATGDLSVIPSESADVYLASLAVLPFANRSLDPENENFTDGVHDDILTALSRLDDLKLISRTSVMRYRNTDTSIREIGRELGVATVLEGSVQRSGDRVRITVQLIDAETDNHLWAETYDEELTAVNVFAIQTDVARKIASELASTLGADAASTSQPPPTESLDAYDRVIEARVLLASREPDNMLRSIELFREAIALDSMYASAHTGFAEAHLILYSWDKLTLAEIRPIVESSLERALALDPLQGDAHTILALYLTNLARYEEAEREWRTAIELVPGYANAHHWFGIMLWEVGRFDESRAQLRRALALDPLSRIINTNVGLGEYFARDYDAAIAHYQRALERFPEFGYTWNLLSLAQSMSGRHDEAIRAGRKALELDTGDANYSQLLASVLARAGEREEARRIMESTLDADPTRIAIAHAALGDTDGALRWLDVALTEGSPFLTELRDPAYDPVRDDPRFEAVLRRVFRAE